jgi:dihydrofolate synthase/folylpolyglutamate synthase
MHPATDICDHASATEFLFGRINYERMLAVPYRYSHFRLDRMRRLLALVGDPHLALKAVHVAGTKGKGSTAAMIAAVLSEAGFKTGLYTSPHLARLEERFAIDGRICSESEFVALAAQLQPAVAEMDRLAAEGHFTSGPTFFEITTAMGMLHFARHNVDAAVLEVGLGGRLDSTNVCLPAVCAITSISFDHTRQLGNTLRAIALEKAGIIKRRVPVVSGVIEPEPRQAIVETATAQEAPLYERGRDFEAVVSDGSPAGLRQAFAYRESIGSRGRALDNLEIPLLGRHQAANGAVAVAALVRLAEQGWKIPDDSIRSGLGRTRCSARVEVIRQRPTVIVDVAHNVASVQAVIDVLRERFSARKRVLLFASSRDKDVQGMLRLLLPEFDEIVLTRYVTNPRAVEVEELNSLAQETLVAGGRPRPAIRVEPDPLAAWHVAQNQAGPDDLVCITGSFFLAAELLPHVRT